MSNARAVSPDTSPPRSRKPARASTGASSQIVRMRLAAQCIADTTLSHPEDAVARLCAVQAQDYLGALWAVGLRVTNATEHDVERAIAERRIMRTWPMRGTLHFVAAADARWITELLAPRVTAAAAGRFRALGIDEPTLRSARNVLVRHLEGGHRATRPAVYDALERAKISTKGQRGIHVLWRLAQDGVLCFGPREGKQHTFVLLEEWMPKAKPLCANEALGELAHRYFLGHGPATVADFAWWSGLKLTDARLAIDIAGKRVSRLTLGGQPFCVAASVPQPATSGVRAFLLPAFDELLVGYADRSAAIAQADALRVNAGGGILNPTIVVDGRVVGTWKRRLRRREVVFSSAPFATITKTQAGAVFDAFRRYARFLGLPPRERPAPAIG